MLGDVQDDFHGHSSEVKNQGRVPSVIDVGQLSECKVRYGIKSPSPEDHSERTKTEQGEHQVQGRLHGVAHGHGGAKDGLLIRNLLLNVGR